MPSARKKKTGRAQRVRGPSAQPVPGLRGEGGKIDRAEIAIKGAKLDTVWPEVSA